MFRTTADKFKILSSYLIGGAAILFCLYTAVTEGLNPKLQVLICLLGGTVGWCVGLYLTPTSEGEKQQLSEFSKALLTLISGFGLGKIDIVAAKISEWVPAGATESAIRILLFLCMLLIGALFTYISRLFVTGTEDEFKTKRAKLIAELKKSVAELENSN
ncbi:MAG: hypothetical protein EXR70_00995 [Deltaproteobacteria bacterium]|nr:hypothetical protein [Deltaproteobacteria bacterium]